MGNVPSTVGNVGEKMFIDLLSISETVRKNRFLLTVQDGFTRFASAYPICNKELPECYTLTMGVNLSIDYGLNYSVN